MIGSGSRPIHAASLPIAKEAISGVAPRSEAMRPEAIQNPGRRNTDAEEQEEGGLFPSAATTMP